MVAWSRISKDVGRSGQIYNPIYVTAKAERIYGIIGYMT